MREIVSSPVTTFLPKAGDRALLPYRFSLFACTCFLLVAACAREQSKEARERERREREIKRLERAEGQFSGTIATKTSGTIPFALVVSINRNPQDGNDEPRLAARVRLGLFGGADLNASAVSFDFGNGRLTASFGGSAPNPKGASLQANSPAKSLELQATVAESDLREARLLATNGTAYSIEATRSPALSLADPTVESIYAIRLQQDGNKQPVDAVLSLSRRTGDQDATVSSDMPRFPQIVGALRFPGAGQVAHNAAVINYDPLADQMDVDFIGGSGMRLAFRQIGEQTMALTGKALSFTTQASLSGYAEVGKRRIGTIVPSPNPNQVIEQSRPSLLSFRNYIGTLRDPDDNEPRKMIANVVYLGSEGSSGGASPFDVFPKQRLTMTYCNDAGEPLASTRFVLSALDYLEHISIFVNEVNSESRAQLNYSQDWAQLSGAYITSIDERSGIRFQLDLHAVSVGDTLVTCRDAYGSKGSGQR